MFQTHQVFEHGPNQEIPNVRNESLATPPVTAAAAKTPAIAGKKALKDSTPPKNAIQKKPSKGPEAMGPKTKSSSDEEKLHTFPSGWKRETRQRKTGKRVGEEYNVYWDPEDKFFPSKARAEERDDYCGGAHIQARC